MIDGHDQVLTHLRDAPSAEWQIINATAWDARTPRSSVEAHGHEERDEDGHPVGTRVSVQFGSGDATSSSSATIHRITFYAAVPMTEAGPYVSNQIVDDIKFTVQLEQTWVPPTVRPRSYYR